MTTKPTLAAEYTNGSKTRSAVLDLSWIANGQREHFLSREVNGKREAREIAKVYGATPWNF